MTRPAVEALAAEFIRSTDAYPGPWQGTFATWARERGLCPDEQWEVRAMVLRARAYGAMVPQRGAR
jgi:hypothetical protein